MSANIVNNHTVDMEKQPLLVDCHLCQHSATRQKKRLWPKMLIFFLIICALHKMHHSHSVHTYSTELDVAPQTQSTSCWWGPRPSIPWEGMAFYPAPEHTRGLVITQKSSYHSQIVDRSKVLVEQTDKVLVPTVTFDIKFRSVDDVDKIKISREEQDDVFRLTVDVTEGALPGYHVVCISLNILVQLPIDSDLDLFEVKVARSNVEIPSSTLVFNERLAISTASGNINIDQVTSSGDVNLRSASGNIKATFVETTGHVKASAASGNIHVNIKQHVANGSTIDIAAASGNTHLDLPNDAESTFHVTTSSGNVHLRSEIPENLHVEKQTTRRKSYQGYYGAASAETSVSMKTASGNCNLHYGAIDA